MAQFQAFEAFNINTIDLNWFLATYEAEVMTENPLGGYEDLYVVYTFFDQALANDAPYCASKSAVEMLMRVLALELAGTGAWSNVLP